MESVAFLGLAVQALIVAVAYVVRMSPAHVVGASLVSLAMFPPDQAPWSALIAAAGLSMLGVGAALVGAARPSRDAEAAPRSWGTASPFVWATALAVVYVLSTLVSGSTSIVRVLAVFAPAIGLGWVASRFTDDDRRQMMRWVGLLVAVQLLLGVLEAYGGLPPTWGVRNTDRVNPFVDGALPRVQGTLGHPITYSLVMVVAMVVGLTRFAPRSFSMHALCLVGGAVGFFLSGTRSGVVAIMLALGVYALSHRRFSTALRAGAIIAGLGAAVYTQRERLWKLTTEALDSGSFQHRTGIIADADRLLHQDRDVLMFGHGLSSTYELFRIGVLRTPDQFKVVDNTFIYLVATAGLVGLVLFALLLASLFARPSVAGRTVVIAYGAYCFSFDIVGWPVAVALLIVPVLAARREDRDAAPAASDPEERANGLHPQDADVGAPDHSAMQRSQS